MLFNNKKSLNYCRELIYDFLKKTDFKITPKKILDIGAGSGEDLILANKLFPSSKLIGVESYYENIKKLNSLNIETCQLNIENQKLPFESESVDIIIANQILEHCKNIFFIFHNMTRVLKREGYLIISVPNLASFHNRLLLLLGYQPTSIRLFGPHVRGFTFKGLDEFINKCSNKCLKITLNKGSNFYPFSPIVAKILSNIFPNSAVSIFVVYQKVNTYNDSFLKYPVDNNLETDFFLED